MYLKYSPIINSFLGTLCTLIYDIVSICTTTRLTESIDHFGDLYPETTPRRECSGELLEHTYHFFSLLIVRLLAYSQGNLG